MGILHSIIFRRKSTMLLAARQFERMSSDENVDMENLCGSQTTPIFEYQVDSPVFRDEIAYPMSFERRGLAIVISNKHFHPCTGLQTRYGTDSDARAISEVLKQLCFDVKIHKDLSVCDMIKLMSHTALLSSHRDSDCFICVILTHGENGVLYGTDRCAGIDQFTGHFKRAKHLLGKPKIFIFQACRGDKLMPAIDRDGRSLEIDHTLSYDTPRIPLEADILLIYSTVPGYLSWRNTENGSWYIQTLCNVLRANLKHKDLEFLRLLTLVNRRVAYDFESNCSERRMCGKRQVPCLVSTLTKELYLFNATKNGV